MRTDNSSRGKVLKRCAPELHYGYVTQPAERTGASNCLRLRLSRRFVGHRDKSHR